MSELQNVPVFDYVQNGDKIKKVRTGWAELVPRDNNIKLFQRTVIRTSCPAMPGFKMQYMRRPVGLQARQGIR